MYTWQGIGSINSCFASFKQLVLIFLSLYILIITPENNILSLNVSFIAYITISHCNSLKRYWCYLFTKIDSVYKVA